MISRAQIIPAILAKTQKEFIDKLKIAADLNDWAQIDIMDGTFVPQSSWADPEIISRILSQYEPAKKIKFDLHLMTDNPTLKLPAWSSIENVGRATAHIEAFKNPNAADGGVREFIEACKSSGWEAGIALNPETEIGTLKNFLKHIDFVLFLGVHPGASGQKLLDTVPEKIIRFKELCLQSKTRCPRIGIDGGVNKNTIKKLEDAGAEYFFAASAIFEASNPKAAFTAF